MLLLSKGILMTPAACSLLIRLSKVWLLKNLPLRLPALGLCLIVLASIKVMAQSNAIQKNTTRSNEIVLVPQTKEALEGILDLIQQKHGFKPRIRKSASGFLDVEIPSAKLKQIPAEFFLIKNIKSLSIASNGLTEISKEILNVESLEYLTITDNPITSIPDGITKLHRLKSLGINANPALQYFSPNLRHLEKLEAIFLSHNDLKEIPKVITEIQTLTVLHLQGNQIENVPAELIQLKHLSFLQLDKNPLKHFSPELQALTTPIINLNYCFQRELPESLVHLRHVKKLHLTHNGLVGIPEWFDQFSQLEALHLNNNELDSIPHHLLHLTHLLVLDLTANNIDLNKTTYTAVDDRSFHLYLAFNNIQDIPENFANLAMLDVLDLRGNPLTKMGHGIFDLAGINKIDITGTQVSQEELHELHEKFPHMSLHLR